MLPYLCSSAEAPVAPTCTYPASCPQAMATAAQRVAAVVTTLTAAPRALVAARVSSVGHGGVLCLLSGLTGSPGTVRQQASMP
jgi:hypothetical protein